MFYSFIGRKGSGFTNQLFSLITSIIISYNNNNKVVVVDYFSNDYSKITYTSISEIFDLKKINTFLKEKYDIIIIDKYEVNFQLKTICYGTKNYNIEVTNIINTNFFCNNKLYIPKGTNLNLLCGDPCVGEKKYIFLKYQINEYLIEEIYEEELKNDIIIDFLEAKYINTFAWMNDFSKEMFEDILVHLEYSIDLIYLSKNIEANLDLNKKINVLHLRLEDDAILYWSKVNNLNIINYKTIIENKYISLIKKYIDPSEQNIILSGSLSNRVIDFLNENKYKIIFSDKYFDGREQNAIIDLLISKYCNNIFIGNFNFEMLNGSTFSYYIALMLSKKIKKIMIDNDKIYDDEKVY